MPMGGRKQPTWPLPKNNVMIIIIMLTCNLFTCQYSTILLREAQSVLIWSIIGDKLIHHHIPYPKVLKTHVGYVHNQPTKWCFVVIKER